MTAPCASETSPSTDFRRSSNSPRYLAPAIRAPMSSEITRRSRSDSGTSPETMRWASPSTIAVLPTPGSPISTGLFFLLRESTWITRRISSSRPITGSSSPCSAASVRSVPNRSSAWYFSSGLWSVTRLDPRTSRSARRISSCPAPCDRSCSPGVPLPSASASSRCSVETYSSPRSRASFSAARSTPENSLEGCVPSPGTAELNLGSAASAESISSPSARTSTPSFPSTPGTTPPGESAATAPSPSSTLIRCSGTTCGLAASWASRAAAAMASWDLIVKRSACITGSFSWGSRTGSERRRRAPDRLARDMAPSAPRGRSA